MPTGTTSGVTLNMDIAGLVTRMHRFIDEALKCQSANAAAVMEYDYTRLESYLAAAINYKNWLTAVPQLDCPESHPLQLSVSLPQMDDVEAVENESIKDWARLMLIAITELMNSQSSRMSSGLVSHDQMRFDAFMTKLNNFLTEYVQVTLPLDLPESIPQAPGVTPGRTGI